MDLQSAITYAPLLTKATRVPLSVQHYDQPAKADRLQEVLLSQEALAWYQTTEEPRHESVFKPQAMR